MATYLSELFPIYNDDNLNWDCFELDTELEERELGNRFSWRFSQQLENAIVTWYDNKFWVLFTLDKTLPKPEEYHNVLNRVQEDLKKDLGDRVFLINRSIEKPNSLPLEVIAKFAVGILKWEKAFNNITIYKDEKGIEVFRRVDYWAESFIDEDSIVKPAIVITSTTKIIYADNIIRFHRKYCKEIELESFLMDTLSVNPIGSNSNVTISKIVGQLSTNRDIAILFEKLILQYNYIKQLIGNI